MTTQNACIPSSFLFKELTEDECQTLLMSKRVGRIVWSNQDGPRALPVNYVMHEGTIMFRTSPYASVASVADENVAAFEVDDIDEYVGTGWSILVTGTPQTLEDPSDLPRAFDDRPFPWAPGIRNFYIQLVPHAITGRRVHNVM